MGNFGIQVGGYTASDYLRVTGGHGGSSHIYVLIAMKVVPSLLILQDNLSGVVIDVCL